MNLTEPIITIFPFETNNTDERINILNYGFVNDLAIELSQFKQFEIRYNDSKSNTETPSDYFIKGTISGLLKEIKISIYLFDSKTNRIVWSDKIFCKPDAIQEIYYDVVSHLVVSLQQQLDIDLLANIRRKKTTKFKAYEYWLRGLMELKKGMLETDENARFFFNKALEIDPEYSLAYSGMSLSYFNEWSCQIWDRWDISQKGAKDWAQKALEIDSENYIANLIMGKVLLFESAFDNSEIYLRKALFLNPNDPFNLIQIASSFVYFGYLDEAETLYEKSLRIDNGKPELYNPVGAYIYFEKKEFQKCISIGEKYLDLSWIDYPVIIAASYYYLGNEKKALQLWKKYVDNFCTRISKADETDDAEALNWMATINPYKSSTAFEQFWQFLANRQDFDIKFIQVSDSDHTKNQFIKKGDVWIITFMGKTIQLPHSKGLQDISVLLANPDTEIKTTELLGSLLCHSGVETSDRQTINDLRAELHKLENKISVAIDQEDDEKLKILQQEYDKLIEYLSTTIDNKGRIRRSNAVTDKSRSAVTQRIKSALGKIEKLHLPLYTHFNLSLKTGNYCSYKPKTNQFWIIEN